MLNDLSVNQIVSLSRQGAAAPEIAAELGLEEELVKLALRANKIGSIEDRDISDAQLTMLRKQAYSLAFNDDPTIAMRMTQFLIERDKPRIMERSGSLVGAINNAIILANGEFEKLKELYK